MTGTYTLATAKLTRAVKAESWGEALKAATADKAIAGVVGIENPKGAIRFFKKRNGVLYPISARVAALEAAMGVPSS